MPCISYNKHVVRRWAGARCEPCLQGQEGRSALRQPRTLHAPVADRLEYTARCLQPPAGAGGAGGRGGAGDGADAAAGGSAATPKQLQWVSYPCVCCDRRDQSVQQRVDRAPRAATDGFASKLDVWHEQRRAGHCGAVAPASWAAAGRPARSVEDPAPRLAAVCRRAHRAGSMHVPSSEEASPRKPALDALAGALAGCVARLIVGPLDVIKIRFQIQVEPIRGAALPAGARPGPSHYTGFANAFRTIVREEGVQVGVACGPAAGQ
jgi:hypothetical protein